MAAAHGSCTDGVRPTPPPSAAPSPRPTHLQHALDLALHGRALLNRGLQAGASESGDMRKMRRTGEQQVGALFNRGLQAGSSERGEQDEAPCSQDACNARTTDMVRLKQAVGLSGSRVVPLHSACNCRPMETGIAAGASSCPVGAHSCPDHPAVRRLPPPPGLQLRAPWPSLQVGPSPVSTQSAVPPSPTHAASPSTQAACCQCVARRLLPTV